MVVVSAGVQALFGENRFSIFMCQEYAQLVSMLIATPILLLLLSMHVFLPVYLHASACDWWRAQAHQNFLLRLSSPIFDASLMGFFETRARESLRPQRCISTVSPKISALRQARTCGFAWVRIFHFFNILSVRGRCREMHGARFPLSLHRYVRRSLIWRMHRGHVRGILTPVHPYACISSLQRERTKIQHVRHVWCTYPVCSASRLPWYVPFWCSRTRAPS